jgi:hypothetical protein
MMQGEAATCETRLQRDYYADSMTSVVPDTVESASDEGS